MPNFTYEELEDLLFYQEIKTENFNLASDSDDELGEDLIHEMNETDMIKNLKLTEETNENFDKRNQPSGRSHAVQPEKMRKNGIGTEILSVVSYFRVSFLVRRFVIFDLLAI